MSNQDQNHTHGRALAFGLSLTLSLTSMPGCMTFESEPGEMGLRAAAIEMFQSVTHSVATTASSPAVADASIIGDLQAITKPFLADGQPTNAAVSLFNAETISIMGADGQMMELERVNNGLRMVGADGDIGIQWSQNFTQLAFHTPQGTYRVEIKGTLSERRRLTALISILGLGGSSEPMAAIAAAAWPIAAIAGLVVVSWGVMCLAYTSMCLNEAETICANYGVASVEVGCGGVSMSFEGGEGVPSGAFEIGNFECTIHCNPPDGGDDSGDGGPGPGFIPPEAFPVPNWDEGMNPCPPGQSPQPCQITEQSTTFDNSGDIEEVTVTATVSFGYCCM